MSTKTVPSSIGLDPLATLEELLEPIGLTSSDAGGRVSFSGSDPIVESKLRLGTCIGVPVMACAVGAAAFWRLRTGRGQDLHLDLRQAIHQINPDTFWHPTVNGFPASTAVLRGNPFLIDKYRTRDGRTVVASAVYPHLMIGWCALLDVPPTSERVAEAIAAWDAFELEEAANKAGLPLCVARTPEEWAAHPQGALLAGVPVIELEQIGDAPVLELQAGQRPFDGIRVLSFTHAIAGPVVGRTLAEQGADVLCGTRPDDFEHDMIYHAANLGSRSANLDLSRPDGRAQAEELLSLAHVVVNNHRPGKLEPLGIEPHDLAARHPGLISVSVTCYGSEGPWKDRGGFDMNGSAASGLMTIEGTPENPVYPHTGMINDFLTGYLGAAGASAALYKRMTQGGSWQVRVSLARTGMWCAALGAVDPALAGLDDEHSIREPLAYDASSPLGDLHALHPPVEFSETTPRWPDPPLVPKGSSRAEWSRLPIRDQTP